MILQKTRPASGLEVRCGIPWLTRGERPFLRPPQGVKGTLGEVAEPVMQVVRYRAVFTWNTRRFESSLPHTPIQVRATTTIPLKHCGSGWGFVFNVGDASYDGSTPVSKTGSGGSIPPASVRRTNRCSPQKAPPASLRRIPGRSKAALKDPASGRFPFPSQGWNGEIQGTAPGRRLRMPVHSSRKSEKGAGPGTSGLPRNSSTVLHVRP